VEAGRNRKSGKSDSLASASVRSYIGSVGCPQLMNTKTSLVPVLDRSETMCNTEDHHDNGNRGYSLRGFFSNWRTYQGPLHVKLRLALRNNWIKFRTLSDCCGNDGQPGC
jgi:hypothetical protein